MISEVFLPFRIDERSGTKKALHRSAGPSEPRREEGSAGWVGVAIEGELHLAVSAPSSSIAGDRIHPRLEDGGAGGEVDRHHLVHGHRLAAHHEYLLHLLVRR